MCVKLLKILCCCKRKNKKGEGKSETGSSVTSRDRRVAKTGKKIEESEKSDIFFMMAGRSKSYPYIGKAEEEKEGKCVSLSAPNTPDFRGEKEQVKLDRPPPLVDSWRPFHLPHRPAKKKRKKKKRRRRHPPLPPETKPKFVSPSFRKVKPCTIIYYPEDLVCIPKRRSRITNTCTNYWKTSKLTVKSEYRCSPVGCVSLSHPATRDYVESESSSNSDEYWDLPDLLDLPPPIPCDVKVDGFFLRPLPFSPTPSPEPEPEKKMEFKMETAQKTPPVKVRRVAPCKPWQTGFTPFREPDIKSLAEPDIKSLAEPDFTATTEPNVLKLNQKLKEKLDFANQADDDSDESERITCKSITPDMSADFKFSKGYGTSTSEKFRSTRETAKWRYSSTPAGKTVKYSAAPDTPRTKILCNLRKKVLPNLRESPLRYDKTCGIPKPPKETYNIPIDKADCRFACDKQMVEPKELELDRSACKTGSETTYGSLTVAKTCPLAENKFKNQMRLVSNKTFKDTKKAYTSPTLPSRLLKDTKLADGHPSTGKHREDAKQLPSWPPMTEGNPKDTLMRHQLSDRNPKDHPSLAKISRADKNLKDTKEPTRHHRSERNLTDANLARDQRNRRDIPQPLKTHLSDKKLNYSNQSPARNQRSDRNRRDISQSLKTQLSDKKLKYSNQSLAQHQRSDRNRRDIPQPLKTHLPDKNLKYSNQSLAKHQQSDRNRKGDKEPLHGHQFDKNLKYSNQSLARNQRPDRNIKDSRKPQRSRTQKDSKQSFSPKEKSKERKKEFAWYAPPDRNLLTIPRPQNAEDLHKTSDGSKNVSSFKNKQLSNTTLKTQQGHFHDGNLQKTSSKSTKGVKRVKLPKKNLQFARSSRDGVFNF